jgi:hypothetical protein
MKSSYAATIAFAVATLTMGQAMAADQAPQAVGKTRAEVQAELAQYRAAHKNDVYDSETHTLLISGSPTDAAPSTKTRAQVLAELAEYRAAHKNDVYDSETHMLISGSATDAAPSTLTRAQVLAELAEYRAAHRYDVFDSETGIQIN